MQSHLTSAGGAREARQWCQRKFKWQGAVAVLTTETTLLRKVEQAARDANCTIESIDKAWAPVFNACDLLIVGNDMSHSTDWKKIRRFNSSLPVWDECCYPASQTLATAKLLPDYVELPIHVSRRYLKRLMARADDKARTTSALARHIPRALNALPTTFTATDVGQKLVANVPAVYIEALYAYRQGRHPFFELHRRIDRVLYDYIPSIVPASGRDVDGKDFAGNNLLVSQWRKGSA